MTGRKEIFIPLIEIPVTLVDSQELNETNPSQIELLKQLIEIGPLRIPRRGNYYQSIEERARQLGLSLSHDQIYPLALILNRNAKTVLDTIKTSKESESDPASWTGPRAKIFNQIRNMFPESAYKNPTGLKSNSEFTDQLNSRLQSLNSQERRVVLEWLRNGSTRLGAQSKLRIEVSDQHYSLSFYNDSGQQEFIGDRRQQFSDVPIVSGTPRTPKEVLERARQEFLNMPFSASDFNRARLYRNLLRAIAANQTGSTIEWRNVNVDGESLQELIKTKGMDLKIEGAPGAEKLTLFADTTQTRIIFEMHAADIGVGQVLNQNKFRGAHLAEGLRMAMLDTTTPQTALTHLRHIATSLKTAASSEAFSDILNGINQSLGLVTHPLNIEIKDGHVKLSRSGTLIPNMSVRLDGSSVQKTSTEENRLEAVLANPERVRALRKAIEILGTAQTPVEKMQAATTCMQEGMERISFTQDGKIYTFNFRTTKVDGDLKNVEICLVDTESQKSEILAKGVISIRGKNVRVIESATVA